MVVAVLGHRGMLGRRVMEVWPDAATTDARFTGETSDPLLGWLDEVEPDWVINCAGALGGEPDLWTVNTLLPRVLAHRWRLVQPSTDHITDDNAYARSKLHGEAGHVIRCAIVDPDGGMLARARDHDTEGELLREWNGITARAWAGVAERVVSGELDDPLIVPGSPTISHHELLLTARLVFGWPTRTLEVPGQPWEAATPTLPMPWIRDQFVEGYT